MSHLTVSYYQDHTIPLVHFPEKLTMVESNEVLEEIKLLTMGGTKIIVDLAGTQMMDSSGLACLVKNRDLISSVLSPQPTVLSLLELTRLTEVLEIT